ncbi:MAG: hypothetical protein IIZ94_16170 [Prevotella sp.]|nr:hypothetical protein [Prevotella sp.]
MRAERACSLCRAKQRHEVTSPIHLSEEPKLLCLPATSVAEISFRLNNKNRNGTLVWHNGSNYYIKQ